MPFVEKSGFHSRHRTSRTESVGPQLIEERHNYFETVSFTKV